MNCVACQAPLSMGFSRPEYWSGLPSPSPADVPDPGIKPGSPALQADSLSSELLGRSPGEGGKATHSSILAWRILRTLWSMELQRVSQD